MLMVLVSTTAFAQTTKQYAKNVELKDGKYYAIKNDSTWLSSGRLTGKSYVDKDGKELPVYSGARGGLYVIKETRAGRKYKYYINI